jgi:hypothetical protein
MSSFFEGYMVEIRQYPRILKHTTEYFCIKDVFYYDSNNKNYESRDTLIPLECFENREQFTMDILKYFINSKIMIAQRTIEQQTSSWSFDTSKLGEIKNGN